MLTVEQVEVERKLFESWARKGPMSIYLQHSDVDSSTYAETFVHSAWQAWKRRAAITTPSSGWKLVPVEPTEEMLAAGDDKNFEHMNAYYIYEAMINSSPTVEVEG